MRWTMERLRRLLASMRVSDDSSGIARSQSRFERSSSFKKRSVVRRSTRRAAARKRAVVTNRGIYYVDEDEQLPGVATGEEVNKQDRHSDLSCADWIEVTDGENTLEKLSANTGAAGLAAASELTVVQKKKKKPCSRNFSLEGKSVPFDSPLPSLHGEIPVDSVEQPVLDTVSPAGRTTVDHSTLDSSCTSGVYSMEKSVGQLDVGRAVRRKQPSVLATKDNLRRSLRRTSKRAKKTTRRQADVDPAKVEEDVYRMFSKLPLLFAERPTVSSTARTPLAYNRQNPITRWLEESERMTRRPVCDYDRPLWSELVSYRPSPSSCSSQHEETSSSAQRTASASSSCERRDPRLSTASSSETKTASVGTDASSKSPSRRRSMRNILRVLSTASRDSTSDVTV